MALDPAVLALRFVMRFETVQLCEGRSKTPARLSRQSCCSIPPVGRVQRLKSRTFLVQRAGMVGRAGPHGSRTVKGQARLRQLEAAVQLARIYFAL